MDLNRVTLIGNIATAPEQKTLTSGKHVTRTSVATSFGWKDSKSGEGKEKTDFHTIVAWNKLGDRMSEYLKKGDRIYVEGRIDNRSYEAKDGTTKYFTDIVADRMIMLGKAKREMVTDEVQGEPQVEPVTEPF